MSVFRVNLSKKSQKVPMRYVLKPCQAHEARKKYLCYPSDTISTRGDPVFMVRCIRFLYHLVLVAVLYARAWMVVPVLAVVPTNTVNTPSLQEAGLRPVLAPPEALTTQTPVALPALTLPETTTEPVSVLQGEEAYMTRGQWAWRVCQHLGLPLQFTVQTMPVFSDVPLSHPQAQPILALWYRGWMQPLNATHGVFAPELPLTYFVMWDVLASMLLPKQVWLLQRLAPCKLSPEDTLPLVAPASLVMSSGVTPKQWQTWHLLQQATCLPMRMTPPYTDKPVPTEAVSQALQKVLPLSAKTTDMQERLERQRQANMPYVPAGIPLAVNPEQFISWKESVVGMPMQFRLVKTIDLLTPLPLPTLTGRTQWLRRFPEGSILEASFMGHTPVSALSTSGTFSSAKVLPHDTSNVPVGCFTLHHIKLQAEKASLPMSATLCMTYRRAEVILKEQAEAYKKRHRHQKQPVNTLTMNKEDTAFFRLDKELSGTFRDDFWVIPDVTYDFVTSMPDPLP